MHAAYKFAVYERNFQHSFDSHRWTHTDGCWLIADGNGDCKLR